MVYTMEQSLRGSARQEILRFTAVTGVCPVPGELRTWTHALLTINFDITVPPTGRFGF
jgi:hypothetical protein